MAAAAAAAASQQSRPSHKPLNGRATPPVGAYMTGKTGGLMMNGFSVTLQTTLSRKTPVPKITNIHL